jgi:hypothetical protein
MTEGPSMEGLAYLAIIATCVWSTASALILPWLLGYTNDPSRRRAVLVGANALSDNLAGLLSADGSTTVVVDAVSWRLDRFRASGFSTVSGDARDPYTYEEAELERDNLVVSMTTNDELNLLVAELVRAEFGVEHPVIALRRPPEGLGRRTRGWIDLLGGRDFDVPTWVRRLENSTARRLAIDPGDPEAVMLLHEVERESPHEVARLAGLQGTRVRMRVDDEHLDYLDRLFLLVSEGRPLDVLSKVEVAPDDEETMADQGDNGRRGEEVKR